MYNNTNFSNLCLDKYYNELILFNRKINLKNINYSKNKYIIKKIIECDNFKIINKNYNYNLFEKLCIFGNYRMVKWLCLEFKFDKNIIYFNGHNNLLFNKNYYETFIENFIYYSIKNNNLKMLKFGSKINRKNFSLYIEHCLSVKHNNIKIMKWIMRNDDMFNKKHIYRNFNVDNLLNYESDKIIKFISKHTKILHLYYKIDIITDKKYKILIWLLLNTKISRYKIELLSWGKQSSIIQKKIYELLYTIKGEIYINLFKNNMNYIKNTKFVKIK